MTFSSIGSVLHPYIYIKLHKACLFLGFCHKAKMSRFGKYGWRKARAGDTMNHLRSYLVLLHEKCMRRIIIIIFLMNIYKFKAFENQNL